MANYPIPYQNSWGYGNAVSQQMYPAWQQSMGQNPTAMQTVNQNTVQMGLKWVDGEVGAKAYPLPQGWPANQPIALWDTNDTVIYLKSINPMGMPNPLQRARYTLEDGQSGEKTRGYSGDTKENAPDMSEYVKKDDLEKLKQELTDSIGQMSFRASNRRMTKEE